VSFLASRSLNSPVAIPALVMAAVILDESNSTILPSRFSICSNTEATPADFQVKTLRTTSHFIRSIPEASCHGRGFHQVLSRFGRGRSGEGRFLSSEWILHNMLREVKKIVQHIVITKHFDRTANMFSEGGMPLLGA
jgi:hypothetical protein